MPYWQRTAAQWLVMGAEFGGGAVVAGAVSGFRRSRIPVARHGGHDHEGTMRIDLAGYVINAVLVGGPQRQRRPIDYQPLL